MRVLTQGQLAQGCARVLIAAFVWSVLSCGIVTVPAGAQVTTRSATTQSVAVVPFENKSGYRPDTYGDEVASAVAVDLEQRLLLDVYPAGEVSLQMKNLGLRPPLNTGDLVRLATELEVTMMVWGDVREARIVMEKGTRYGQVTVGIRLFDRVAQGDVNGALITAQSPPSAESSADDLIASALKQAVFLAVGEMKTKPPITAKVIWAKGGQIFTNTGTRGDVRPGLMMAAIRDGERIAVVRVTEADAVGAYATVVSGAMLRTGDYLRALYELPGTGPRKSVPQRVKSNASGLEKPFITIAGLALLAGMTTASRGIKNGDVVTTNMVASGLANVMNLPAAFAVPLSEPANLVTWSDFNNTQSKRVAAYELYRGGILIDVIPLVGERPNNFLFDDFFPRPPDIGTTWRSVTLDVLNTTGEITWSADSSTFPESENQTFTDWENGLDPRPGFIAKSDTEFSYGWILFGPFADIREYYQVRPLIITNHSNSTDPNLQDWRFSDDTEASTPSNPVTGVAPPLLDQAMLVGSVATFLFYHPMGADEMILEVQRDQGVGGEVDFARTSKTFSTIITSLDPSFGGDLQQVRIPFSSLQSLTGTSDVYWWRVGGHNRTDTQQPRPWPKFNAPNDPDQGWVWTFPPGHVILTPSMGRQAYHDERAALRAAGADARTRARDFKRPRPMHVPR